jgi:hypothetical protein
VIEEPIPSNSGMAVWAGYSSLMIIISLSATEGKVVAVMADFFYIYFY